MARMTRPVPLLGLRASPDERDALLSISHSFYAPRAGRDRMTDSYRRLAPKKLTALPDQQRRQ
jgi:hypothetical protein